MAMVAGAGAGERSVVDDAEIVAGLRRSAPEAMTQLYDAYADAVHGFADQLLRSPAEAADVTHDTILIAIEKVDQLRDPAKLRPWLFSIARNCANQRYRQLGRLRRSDDDLEREVVDPGPPVDDAAADTEAVGLVVEALAGLDVRDRMALELTAHQGLDGSALGEALGVSRAHAYVILQRARERLDDAVRCVLLLRRPEACPDLAAVTGGATGALDPELRKQVAAHRRRCSTCEERARTIADPWALYAALPLAPAPLWLRDAVLDDARAPAEVGRRRPDQHRLLREDRSGPGWPSALSLVVLGLAALVAALLLASDPDDGVGTTRLVSEGARGDLEAATTTMTPTTPTTAAAVADGPTAAPPTTIAVSPDSAGDPRSTTPPTTPLPIVGSGDVVASVASLDFGDQRSSIAFDLRNRGDADAQWSLAAGPLVGVDRTAGVLRPGESASVQATLDRATAPEGAVATYLELGGTSAARLPVVAGVYRAPTVGPLGIASTSIYVAGGHACAPKSTSVTATVTDESAVSVELVVLLAGSELRFPMAPGPTGHAATVGPFAQTGTAQVHVEATDQHGRRTTGTPRALQSLGCLE